MGRNSTATMFALRSARSSGGSAGSGRSSARRRPAIYRKEIVYDRETRDYAMFLDGELVGFARNYHEAEVLLDQLVFELMTGQYWRESA
jgi:hypothetical protein